VKVVDGIAALGDGVAPHLASARTLVSIQGVSKSFMRKATVPLQVLQNLDFTADDGEFVSVIGPSGCGKSTLFGLLAGLDVPDSGTIEVNGAPIDKNTHAVAYMPQKDLLFPWRSVLDNVTLPLQIQGVPKDDARRRARELFPAFGIEGFEDVYPFTLSGGMRQRAALMRTVIQDRPLMLLDEPFGALDSLTRTEMQDFLLDVWERFRHTIIFITHDIREAIYLSDRIYVMTARPARVRMIVDVPLPRPRVLELVASQGFAELEASLLRTLREESHQMRAEETAARRFGN
jgi:ABC-type nitrate/sulfonate/bicarbonate transport system ATPase subunit